MKTVMTKIQIRIYDEVLKVINNEQDVDSDDSDDSQSEGSNLDDDDDDDDDDDIFVFQENKKGSTSRFMVLCCAMKRTEFLLLVKSKTLMSCITFRRYSSQF